MKNIFQAAGGIKGFYGHPGTYPTVPAQWPNRATRRAIKGRKESRLAQPWREFLALFPDWRKQILRVRAS